MDNFTISSFADVNSKYGMENSNLDISNVLKEQGVRIDDLMALRESLMKGVSFFGLRDKIEILLPIYSLLHNAGQFFLKSLFDVQLLGGFKFNDEIEGDFEDGYVLSDFLIFFMDAFLHFIKKN